MKVVLKSGDEYQINSVFMQKEDQLCISFAGITSYDELRAALSPDATEEIKIYSTDTDFTVYEHFVTVINPSTVTRAADGTYDVVIVLEKADEVTLRLNVLQVELTAAKEANATLQETVDLLVLSALEV